MRACSIPVTSETLLADTIIYQTSRSLSPSLTYLPLTGNVYVPYYHLTAPSPPIRFLQLSQRLRIRNRQR